MLAMAIPDDARRSIDRISAEHLDFEDTNQGCARENVYTKFHS